MLTMDDETEKRLRKLAYRRYGGKKGSLSQVVSEALRQMETEDKDDWEKRRQAFIAQKGLSFEYAMYTRRSEIYD